MESLPVEHELNTCGALEKELDSLTLRKFIILKPELAIPAYTHLFTCALTPFSLSLSQPPPQFHSKEYNRRFRQQSFHLHRPENVNGHINVLPMRWQNRRFPYLAMGFISRHHDAFPCLISFNTTKSRASASISPINKRSTVIILPSKTEMQVKSSADEKTPDMFGILRPDWQPLPWFVRIDLVVITVRRHADHRLHLSAKQLPADFDVPYYWSGKEMVEFESDRLSTRKNMLAVVAKHNLW